MTDPSDPSDFGDIGDIGVVELRQYTLKPGRRDELVEVFDRELVTTQEECGIVVLGQLLDLDRPDRFVWLRGFPDMDARRASLKAFYGGPAWAAHGPAANATMIDWDDVLLLRPVTALPDPGDLDPDESDEPLVISVHDRGSSGPADDDLMAFETLHADNTFRSLPVREDLDVLVRVRRGPAPEVATRQVIRAEPTGGSRLR